MMKGFHHPKGNQQAFLRGLAHLYNLVPYQRRAQHARPMWGGSRRRNRPNTGLVPQPANPYVRRLAMSGDTPYH